MGLDPGDGDWLEGVLRKAFPPPPEVSPHQLGDGFEAAWASAQRARDDPQWAAELDAFVAGIDPVTDVFDEALEILGPPPDLAG